MRPVQKGPWPIDPSGQPKQYKPSSSAKLDLEAKIGPYCSYCEESQSSLAVEHVVSQDQASDLKHNWHNLLLSCSRCNGSDNKWNRAVDLEEMYFPHLDNTYLALCYTKGGVVTVQPALSGTSEFDKADRLLRLVGLDKSPGHPQHHPNDTRWKTRMERWEFIEGILAAYETNHASPDKIGKLAAVIGYFSIWYTLFAGHPEVLQALIAAFEGTAIDCFDGGNNYAPIARKRA
jgi:uncharacterized protein (TIGR02646 family)